MIYLSVIVPIRNEERFIRDTLVSLITQSYPAARYELIVVDGASTDSTVKVVEEVIAQNPDVSIRLLDNPGRWSSIARNIGVRCAVGELIAVIDGHVKIHTGELFNSIEEAHRESGALCLARPAPLDGSVTPASPGYWIAMARKCRLGHSGASYIYSDVEGLVSPLSSGFAYASEVFERVGYFDETFDAAEDVEFHYRLEQAGIKAYTSPRLAIPYFPRETLAALFGQMTRYGLGRLRLCRKFPGAITPETLVPPLFVLGLLVWLLSLLLFSGSALSWLATAIYGVYALLIGREALKVVGAQKRKRAPYVAAALFAIHSGLGCGFLGGLLKGLAEKLKNMLLIKKKRSGEKCRVAFVIDRIDSPTAGTEVHLTRLIRRLDREHFEPYLCVLEATQWSAQFAGCPVYTVGVSSFKKISTYLNIFRFSRFLRREAVDIVQTYFADGNKVGSIAGRLAGVPTIVSTRRNQGYWHNRAEKIWLRLLKPLATLFLANSEDTRRWAIEAEGLPPEKVRVIPNAVELDTLPADPAPLRAAARSAWGVDASGFVVGIVANLRPVKRVDLFLEAAALVAAKVDGARFVIIGEGEERSALETLAADLGIADRVRFLGLVHDVSGLLHGFDVGVLSSDSESFSNAVLEYMAASRPVVATDVGALGEAVADGESGFLVKRADAEALAARIVELHDPAVAGRLGRRGAEIVARRFSADKIISEFEELYLNIRSKR